MMNEERLVKDDVLFGAVGGWVLVCSGCTVLLGAAHDLAMFKANMILVFG